MSIEAAIAYARRHGVPEDDLSRMRAMSPSERKRTAFVVTTFGAYLCTMPSANAYIRWEWYIAAIGLEKGQAQA